ncbi:hypothetical protein [Nostoc sp.]|uniref:hypothetical protein n=1 Tax=Nostoc sp. TaxID=1180 RepID=UPI002FF9394D
MPAAGCTYANVQFLTGSLPKSRESILGGRASSSLTTGRASFKYIPQPGGWEQDDTNLWAFLNAICL